MDLPVPLFLKPLAEGSSKGVSPHSLVRSRGELAAGVPEHAPDQYRQPVLVETFLPGREVTVGIVGNGAETSVVGVMEVVVHRKGGDGGLHRLNKEEYLERVKYRLLGGEPLAEQATWARARGVRHPRLPRRRTGRPALRRRRSACTSSRSTRLPGINHVRSDLPIMARLAGIPYGDLIGAIVDSARERYGLSEKLRCDARGVRGEAGT